MTDDQASSLAAGTSSSDLDLRLLLRARLWVARLGERDVHSWWATDGILGPDGAFVGPRVLPKTHPTGRARIAFAVARHACDERHPDPSSQHLFRLDPTIEDAFDQLLIDALDDVEWWSSATDQLESITQETDAEKVLRAAEVAGTEECADVRGRELGPSGRSLPLSKSRFPNQTIRRLAAGFIRSEPGELAVPIVAGETE